MTAKELRELAVDELLKKEEELSSSIFKVRFRSVMGQEKEANKIKFLKRDIARIKTVLHEKTNREGQ